MILHLSEVSKERQRIRNEENCHKYLTKGAPWLIHGRIKSHKNAARSFLSLSLSLPKVGDKKAPLNHFLHDRYWNTYFRLKLIKFNARCNHHIKIFHLSFISPLTLSQSLHSDSKIFFSASHKKRMNSSNSMKLLTTIFFISHISRALPYFCWRSLTRNWNANVEGSFSAVWRNFVST